MHIEKKSYFYISLKIVQTQWEEYPLSIEKLILKIIIVA